MLHYDESPDKVEFMNVVFYETVRNEERKFKRFILEREGNGMEEQYGIESGIQVVSDAGKLSG